MRRFITLVLTALGCIFIAVAPASYSHTTQDTKDTKISAKAQAPSKAVMIWQGKLHLGDDPGIFGDAQYTGICAELPIRVIRLDPTKTDDGKFSLILDTDGLETFGGYNGQLVTVVAYEPDPKLPYHSVERELTRAYFTSTDNNQKVLDVIPGKGSGPFYLSVRIRSDTTVNPGLYNDFLWKRLSYKSDDYTYYSKFGFN